MANASLDTAQLQVYLDRLRSGDAAARDEFFRRVCSRLERLAHQMLRAFPGVKRWEQTDDVLQNALIRLLRALPQVQPDSVRDFLALTSELLRRELIDLARHYYGPRGPGTNLASNPGNKDSESAPYDRPDCSLEPSALAGWREFHEQARMLPQGGAPTQAAGSSTQPLGLWTPKIADFGLAKWRSRPDGQPEGASLTQTGIILGTPCYLAPEQAEAKSTQLGPAADIYSLGAILYELLTGRPPFQGETILETLDQVRAHEPVPPSHIRPRLPRDLETICLKCLRKEPGQRYGSTVELADDLRRFLAGQPILARATPVWEKTIKWAKRKPALAGLVGVVIIAVAALLAEWARFTKELRAERDRARTAWEWAERARDQATTARRRAEAILDRSLRAIDRQVQVTEESKDAARTQGQPGLLLYEVARSYAVASGLYSRDPELAPSDRNRLAEQYASRAVNLLAKARAVGYFANSNRNLIKLTVDRDLDNLRSRPDFQKLLADVQRAP